MRQGHVRASKNRGRAVWPNGLALSLALAGSAAARGDDTRFERISIEQGLSQSTVNAVVQDVQGFLWAGTQDGLNRYDGYGFTVFRNDPEDPRSLSNNLVWTIVQDRSGRLWLGTAGGLDRFDRRSATFRRQRLTGGDAGSPRGQSIQAILEDRSGSLWIGTERDGLYRLAVLEGSEGATVELSEHYRHDPEDPDSLSLDEVRALYEDRSGSLWIGTNGGGLSSLDPATGTFTDYRHDGSADGLAHDEVVAIHQDRSSRLWIGTDGGGLDRLDPASGSFTHYRHDPADPTSLSHDEVRVIYEDESALWIGTDGGGLNRLDPERGVFSRFRNRPANRFSLANDFVRSAYRDASGILWIGTDGGGLAKLDRDKNVFRHYRSDGDVAGLSHSMVFSICEDRSGELWIGTWGGLNRLDRTRGVNTVYRHDPGDPTSLANDEIWPLLEDRSGTLWIGTFGGLDRLDPDLRGSPGESASATFRHYRHDPEDAGSLSRDYVRALYEDSAGTLWVGTDGGLNRFHPETESFTRYRHDPSDSGSLGHDDVRAIHEDRSGALWLGTAGGGLDRFDRRQETFRHYRRHPATADTLSNDFVKSIYEDSSSTLWIGTDGGLNRLDRDRETFRRYTTADGLPNDVVYGILEDGGGYLWLSTNFGLSRFDPRAETFSNFDADDGLQGNELNTGAYFKSASGELFFGGINGLTSFDPARLESGSFIPPVVITELKKFNEPVRLDVATPALEELALSWRDAVFSFEFAALDFHAPEKNRYAYRLEGFNDDWIELGTKRDITFTNIDPGSYVLRVKGSNHRGLWNETGKAIRIRIAPPPWQSWWAYSLYVLASVAIVGGYLAAQRRKIARERAVSQQLRELGELKDELLTDRALKLEERGRLIAELEGKNAELERFTYTVSHDLKSPLVTINGYLGFLERDAVSGNLDRLRRDIVRIRAAAGRMQQLLDELLDLSRVGRIIQPPEELALGDLARVARAQLAGVIAEGGARVEIAPDLPRVAGDRGRLVEVLQNLIENAIKHSGSSAPRVEIGWRRDGAEPVTGDPVVFVRDDGVGIEPRYQGKVFGLFERLDAESEGTGVGLALVKRIVEVHGGRIWIESEGNGDGATFCFTLPAAGDRRATAAGDSPTAVR